MEKLSVCDRPLATQPFSQNRPEGGGVQSLGVESRAWRQLVLVGAQGLSEGSKEKALKGWT